MPGLPDYWLPRPSIPLDPSLRAGFDHILAAARSSQDGPLQIEYSLPVPRWQFLSYAAEQGGFAMHGSGAADIRLFEPRQSNDLNEFGNRKAVYAAGDGIWAMFFAIVDRERVPSITNACIRLQDAAGLMSEPYYVFSVSRPALPQAPWRRGTVYLLPRQPFHQQAPIPFGDLQVLIPQLASLEPVTPLARLEVEPDDFPFLAQVRAHDDSRLAEYAAALQNGAPWPAD